jgi:sugar lactone lactonase YvrE
MNRVLLRATLLSALVLVGALPTYSQSLVFSTVAGDAGQGSADGLRDNARFVNPSGVAADGVGNLYVADTANHTIRKITSSGIVTTLAGSAGVSGSANGTGIGAQFNQPQGVAVDSSGNVYVADTGNHTIRKLTVAGAVSTLAGLAGSTGSADGAGGSARFYEPEGVAVDSTGNVYVADTWNHTIRKITAGGTVSTLAGLAGTYGTNDGTGGSARFYEPQGVAVDSAGVVYVADTGNQTIRKIASGGAVSTFAGSAGIYGSVDGTGAAARFYGPAGVSVDSARNVYVADYLNQTVRKITSGGVVSTLAGLAGSYGNVDSSGGGARFWGPVAVAVSGTNAVTVYVADSANGTIRQITGGGAVSSIAGSASTGSADSSGSAARFYWPSAAALDSAGNVYVADTQNGTVRKMTAAGVVSTLAGFAGSSGTNDGAGSNARFYGPQGVVAGSAGVVYVADTVNATIRKVTAGGAVTTFAGAAGSPGIADGTGSAARFYGPQGLALDSAGTLYVADTWNHTIRKVTAAGVVSTLAGLPGSYGCSDGTGSNVGTNVARFYCPAAVAVDGAKNVYVADYFNHTIRRITPAGVVSTLAGLPGVWGSADGMNSAARFNLPAAIAVDAAVNIYVLDSGNQTIRKLSLVGTNWVVSTVGGAPGVSGANDGVASAARFTYPAGLAMDAAGNLFIADRGNNTIRAGALEIGGAPAIVSQPQSQSVNPGGDATFTVGAIGQGPLFYQWYFNAGPIIGAVASSYTRSNVQAGQGGNYSVVVSNSLGTATSASAALTVNGPPYITVQPQPQLVSKGESATFSVVVGGTAPLFYQWLVNGREVPGANGPSYSVPAVQGGDQGYYSVVVTNVFGAAVSSSALLAIYALDAWGDDTWNQTVLPPQGFLIIAVTAGAWHSLGLRIDGTVVAWGNDSSGQCAVPVELNDALAIAAGGYHSLAARANGSVVAWGANDYGQTNVPVGLSNVMGVSAGTWHSLALRRDGTVVAWGDNSWGQCSVPFGLTNVVEVAAGGNHSLALLADGTVVAWGENTDAQGHAAGQSVVPTDLAGVVAIAAGEYHSLAVRSNGTVVAWGDNSQGQIGVPVGLTNVVAVAGGGAHSLALTADGNVVAWGANWNAQCSMPAGLADVVGIGAGESHSVALLSSTLPVPEMLSPNRQGSRFSMLAQTLNRKSYALEFKSQVESTNWNGVTTNSGNGAVRQLTDPDATTSPRFYRMRQW